MEKRLLAELRRVNKGISRFVLSAWRGETASDASPLPDILLLFGRERTGWERRWESFVQWFCEDAILRVKKTTDRALLNSFRDSGFAVKFDASKLLDEAVMAAIGENVSLLKSVAATEFDKVQDIIVDGLKQGRDVQYVKNALEERFDMTERRAALVARDQMDKACQTVQRARDNQLGITEGIWVHLPGLKTSRASHVAMNGERFPLNQGIYDPDVGEYVLPGQLIACRCTYTRVIPEFGDV